MELLLAGAASAVIGFVLHALPRGEALEANAQLLEAAREGKVSTITSLVDSGLSVDALGEHGETALMVAAGAGQSAVVELLLSIGASMTLTAAEDVPTTPGLRAGGTCVHAAAAAAGNELILAALLDRDSAAVRASDTLQNSPLHAAAAAGRASAVQTCLARGAAADARNCAGCTPLALAASDGGVEALRLLLEHGADVHACDADGNTALHRACAYAHEGAVGLLLGAGAGLYDANHNGASPLVLAAPHPAVAALLQEQAARLAAQGDPQAAMAQAARVRLEARLGRLGQAEPQLLNALIQEHDGQMRALLLRFQIDPRVCVPAGALDERSLEIAAQIAAVLNAGSLPAPVDDGTARATVELRRLANQIDMDEEPS